MWEPLSRRVDFPCLHREIGRFLQRVWELYDTFELEERNELVF